LSDFLSTESVGSAARVLTLVLALGMGEARSDSGGAPLGIMRRGMFHRLESLFHLPGSSLAHPELVGGKVHALLLTSAPGARPGE
jgi:hypothetical protein